MDKPVFPFLPPTLVDTRRIAALGDPVVRNLQITQCYHELSRTLCDRLGQNANWCTFATWASKQAGQTIRKEDLKRTIEQILKTSQEPALAAGDVALHTQALSPGKDMHQIYPNVWQSLEIARAVERSSEAVGHGNQKVFAEIGYQFARFYTECYSDETPDPGKIAAFCRELSPGKPPDGQDYLKSAFTQYYQALFETDPKMQAERVLLANLLVGFHEQTRLQPEILAALDAPFLDETGFLKRLFASTFPRTTALALLARTALMRLLGRPPALELAARALLSAARKISHQVITESMMVITFPGGVRIRLWSDLVGEFPAVLMHTSLPELQELLINIDPTPNSLKDSGAADWSSLPERLHFIADLFRLNQLNETLFSDPFTSEQVEVIKEGVLPEGPL